MSVNGLDRVHAPLMKNDRRWKLRCPLKCNHPVAKQHALSNNAKATHAGRVLAAVQDEAAMIQHMQRIGKHTLAV